MARQVYTFSSQSKRYTHYTGSDNVKKPIQGNRGTIAEAKAAVQAQGLEKKPVNPGRP